MRLRDASLSKPAINCCHSWLEHPTGEWKVLGLGKGFGEAAGTYAVKMEFITFNTSFTFNLQLAAGRLQWFVIDIVIKYLVEYPSCLSVDCQTRCQSSKDLVKGKSEIRATQNSPEEISS